jgi:hypothetical protein
MDAFIDEIIDGFKQPKSYNDMSLIPTELPPD